MSVRALHLPRDYPVGKFERAVNLQARIVVRWTKLWQFIRSSTNRK